MQIEVEISRQKRRGPHAENKDALSLQQHIHHTVKLPSIHPLDGGMDAVHVPLHDLADHVRSIDLLLGRAYALHGGQAAPHQLLQCALHAGISIIAQLGSKPHHGGFADLRDLSQTLGRQERSLIGIIQYVISNALLRLGKSVKIGSYLE